MLTTVKMFRTIWIAMVLLVVATGGPAMPAYATESSREGLINCDIHHGPCTKEVSNCKITFDISPRPVKAMTDLTFRIALQGKELSGRPHIELGMPGMDMGPNRVSLRPLGNGRYEGQGVIVRCPSGRRTWKAAVTLPDVGVVEFVFDVLY